VSVRPLPDDTTRMKGREGVVLDELKVTGSRAPLTQLQAAKLVSVVTRAEIQRAAAATVNDLLKQATGVDVRQRGGFGVQTDISLNGGTFDQITLLLNGVNISNPQTGHNAADLPVSLSDIERIEILEGASARLFGSSAFCGAINIVTKADRHSGAQVQVEGGSYGSAATDASVALAGRGWHNQLSGGYMRTDGGTSNSDFRKGHAFCHGDFSTNHLDLKWQAGLSLQDYGANTFYSAKYDNQFEATRRWISSLSADVYDLPGGLTLQPSVYWTRSFDHYQLIRGMEGAKAGENYHKLDVYGASLNGHISWSLGKTAVGVDVRREHILSTALGEPLDSARFKPICGSDRKYEKDGTRTNTSLFVEHNLLFRRLTLSAGLLANQNSALSGGFRLYPGVDLSWRPSDSWKLYLSCNKALRMPTYTDMYMDNVVQKGDPHLNPERNTTVKAGARFRHAFLEVVGSAFYSRGRDIIDWVKPSEQSSRYESMNIGKLDNMGFSLDLTARWPAARWIRQVKVGYAFIHQNHSTQREIFKSLYALEYLRHKLTAQVEHRIVGRLSASWHFRWQQRMNGYHPYAKIDAKLRWNAKRYELWLQADNLTNHRYYDLSDVLQPGLWVMVGARVKLPF